jgi:hypothetical protein
MNDQVKQQQQHDALWWALMRLTTKAQEMDNYQIKHSGISPQPDAWEALHQLTITAADLLNKTVPKDVSNGRV